MSLITCRNNRHWLTTSFINVNFTILMGRTCNLIWDVVASSWYISYHILMAAVYYVWLAESQLTVPCRTAIVWGRPYLTTPGMATRHRSSTSYWNINLLKPMGLRPRENIASSVANLGTTQGSLIGISFPYNSSKAKNSQIISSLPLSAKPW